MTLTQVAGVFFPLILLFLIWLAFKSFLGYCDFYRDMTHKDKEESEK